MSKNTSHYSLFCLLTYISPVFALTYPLFIRTFVALVFSVQVVFCATAQDKEHHSFTDKKGQSIEAALVSIDPKREKVKIQRKDGRHFEIAILTLSLDDQLYIKDWLNKTPNSIKFKLAISVTRHQESTDRVDVPNYDLKWVTDHVAMEIKVHNLSRADLNGAVMEYYVLTEQGVRSQPYGEAASKQYGVAEWWYANDPAELPKLERKNFEKPLLVNHGKVKLKNLAYNYSATTKTETIPLRTIEGDTSARGKDNVLGVIVKVSTADGKEISVYRSSDHKALKESWEKIAALPPGDPLGNPPAPVAQGPAS